MSDEEEQEKQRKSPAENWEHEFGISPENIDDLISLADLFIKQKKPEEAEKVYEHILLFEPDNSQAKNALEELRSESVPRWHFTMLADTNRNDAFEKAIKKHTNRKTRILDIGTGSGLLSMMAARCGAKEIIACEEHEGLFRAAKRIVDANGFGDSIKVINKRSSHLEQGEDYNEKFDLIICEILDSGGLGEGVLPTLRQAKEEVATKNVRIIPAGISLKAQLIEIPKLHQVNPIKSISGFDLSIFDEFRVSDTYTPLNLAIQEYKPLSEVFDLRAYDFNDVNDYEIDFNKPEIDTLEPKCIESGQLQAVAFWFDLHMDEEDTYSSGPGGELDHWLQAIYYFEQPKDVTQGDRIKINALYSDWMVRFRLP
ncbi:50S ribosomal protein L11 methyltransferase [Roseivirga sp. E12]|uniref:50S ribosomal protein L11 methyltransferase n=1 Tax=Roseivirga sp. E12 TaxID=2819237 RepID=UPI001ABC18A8|nr:50S ribosomal protein L11 methyltransferase [Roseivirga sp. E12]MBO3698795.1 50S ribosomal protein L11 methyltransferase [Roseivirga sp. E12]